MTKLSPITRLVVFFDLCSSTTILEDLLQTENQWRWRQTLMELKDFLRVERTALGFEIYKFIGDGWILLFQPDISPLNLTAFLRKLCKRYDSLYAQKIKPVLQTDIQTMGVTFGIDRGTVVKVVMDGKDEYIGRPLNVAARLQGAIKDKDKHPQGKVLLSKTAYVRMQAELKGQFPVDDVTRTLRNISGGANYHAKKLHLFKP